MTKLQKGRTNKCTFMTCARLIHFNNHNPNIMKSWSDTEIDND